MNKLIISAVVTVTALSTLNAFAAPAARQNSARPCAHCTMSSHGQIRVATPHAGQYGLHQQQCNHATVASNVRWGKAQMPCPHCKHMG